MHPVRLTSAFQPIVALVDPRYPRAMEALARFPFDTRPPDLVFADAWRTGHGAALELDAVSLHLEAGALLPLDIAIAVNLSTETVTRHAEALAYLLRKTSRLVIVELTESTDADDLHAIAQLRSAGVAIALDDAGAGRTGPARIRRLSPDIVKLDGALLRAAGHSSGARELVREIAIATAAVGAEFVAEGIESVADVACAIAFGASMGQGYAFGAPAPVTHYAPLRRSA
jgi:EAL domain-containing protein (putative c-di-GMP-specific phosphodiesterase class I)